MRELLQRAFHLDVTGLAITPALRAAFGILVLLAVGIATGQAVLGVAAAGGAIGLGTMSLSGTYRGKLHVMLPACMVLAVSAFAGSLAGQTGWLFVVIAGIWGFAGGMFASLGQVGTILGLMSTAMLIVFSHIPLAPAQAALTAGALLVGGLFQTALAIAPWPLHRFRPEREALAAVYRGLAAYADDPSGYRQVTGALSRAASTLRSGDSGGDEGGILRDLFVEADRVHLELVRLSDARKALTGDAARGMDSLTHAAAAALRSLAVAIERERAPRGLQDPARRIEAALDGLGEPGSGDDGLAVAYALDRGKALGRELRAAAHIASLLEHPDEADAAERVHPRIPHFARSFDRGNVEVLRANLNRHAVTFQHAVRLGIALVIGAALYKGVPIGRGYWMPFTALMVLRPDFTTTVTRGVARWAGTAAGVVLTTLLVALVPLDNATLTALVVAAAFVAYSVFSANYALYSVFLTAQVVFLIAFTGTSPDTAALDRLIDTAIGAALGLVIFMLWPTWERRRVPGNLADMLKRERGYFDAVMGAYLDPETDSRHRVLKQRLAARMAIANARSSVQSSRLEPGSDRVASDAALGVLDATKRLNRALLALDANLERRHYREAPAEVGAFTRAADDTMSDLEAVLRDGVRTSSLKSDQDLAGSVEALRRWDERPAGNGRPDLTLFVSQADRIADSLDTMRHVLMPETGTTGEAAAPAHAE